MVLANPLPAGPAARPGSARPHAGRRGWRWSRPRGSPGKDVTPRLLEYFHEATGGASLRVNVDLVLANAALAGQIAGALAGARLG